MHCGLVNVDMCTVRNMHGRLVNIDMCTVRNIYGVSVNSDICMPTFGVSFEQNYP